MLALLTLSAPQLSLTKRQTVASRPGRTARHYRHNPLAALASDEQPGFRQELFALDASMTG